jgi:chromosome partitioning protein
MRVISFLTQKGGTGKSTLALNLAVTAQRCGERVVVIDLDPQGTAASWHKTRRSETPALIEHTEVGILADTLRRLSAGGFSLALIDTPGTDSPVTHGAMCAADLCLVPVRPSEADVRATMPTVRALSALRRPYALVINQAPARLAAPAPLRLDDFGPVLPIVMAARVDHQYAYALGLGVQEYAPEGKATAEVVELWRAVRNRMGMKAQPETCAGSIASRRLQHDVAEMRTGISSESIKHQVGADRASRLASNTRFDRTPSGPLAVTRRPCS